MEFMDISSLGVAYQYAVKFEQKFKKHNKWEFRYQNKQHPKYGKCGPKSQEKGHNKDGQTHDNYRNHQQRRVMESQRRTLEYGASSTKSLGTILMNVSLNNHCWLR
jgi:hypothetical protein